MTYVGIYLGLLFSSIVSANQRPFRFLLFAVFSLLLFGFVAFRFEVGCDWSGYENNFELARYWSVTEALARTEPGYWSLIVQLHGAGLPYPYLNLAMAIPFFWGIIALARREPDPLAFLVLSFPVLILNMPMSAIRQSAAIGFFCLALIAFRDRKALRFVLMIALGSLFHSSVIVFLALAPFAKVAVTRSSLALAAVLLLPGLYFTFADALAFYADRYVNSELNSAGALYRSALLAAVGGYFVLGAQPAFREKFPADYATALIGSLIMIATLAVVPFSSVIADRFGYYVTPIQIMIMARLPYVVSATPTGRLIAAAPYAGLAAVLIYWAGNSRHFQLCYLPYQSWLSWP